MDAEQTRPADRASRAISAGWVLAALVLLFGIDNLLVARFLAIGGAALPIAGMVLVLLVAGGCARAMDATIPLRRIAICLGIGIAVMALGGEGRFFYANVDWQTRDASLADMIRSPWPFVYAGRDRALLLPRFPIGMYLIPALAGKAFGRGSADIVLLLQNGMALGLLLALGSLLGATRRARGALLGVALAFGGLDIVGTALLHPDRLLPLAQNIEGWGPTIYQSDLAQAYWTPHHAIAGWTGAILFLLWRTGRIPLRAFLAPLPLVAIWSPLGLIGTMPFAALAGIETIVRARLSWADVVLPLAAIGVTALPLVYLGADAGAVGLGFDPIPVLPYLLFVGLEVVPLLACVAAGAWRGRFGAATVAVTAACLLAFPFVTIGESVDFTMRAGAPALAVLAVMVADLVASPPGIARGLALGFLLLGAAGPAHDTIRALALEPSPPPRCDFWDAWNQSFASYGHQTYLARLPRVPGLIRPMHPAIVDPIVSGACWSRPWAVPRWPAAHRWLA